MRVPQNPPFACAGQRWEHVAGRDDPIDQWYTVQSARLARALEALCPKTRCEYNDGNICDPESCRLQANVISTAIAIAIADYRRKNGEQMGGNRGNWVNLPGHIPTIFGYEPIKWNNECIEWAFLVNNAASQAIAS